MLFEKATTVAVGPSAPSAAASSDDVASHQVMTCGAQVTTMFSHPSHQGAGLGPLAARFGWILGFLGTIWSACCGCGPNCSSGSGWNGEIRGNGSDQGDRPQTAWRRGSQGHFPPRRCELSIFGNSRGFSSRLRFVEARVNGMCW